MAYSEDAASIWRRAAGHVDRILRGAKPADLPVEESSRFVLSINLKTARLLGITIEKSVLLQADEVFECAKAFRTPSLKSDKWSGQFSLWSWRHLSGAYAGGLGIARNASLSRR